MRNPHQVRLSISPTERLDARGSICGDAKPSMYGVPSMFGVPNLGGGGGSARDSLSLPDEEEAVINVFSRKSSLARTITSLHLDASTTAGQVVGQFCRLHGVERLVSTPEEGRLRPLPGVSSLHRDPEEPYKLFLYEVGGNVGERRLDPDVNMREALSKNPNATWIVKNRLQAAK